MAISLEQAVRVADLYNQHTVDMHSGRMSVETFETISKNLFDPHPEYQPNPQSFKGAWVSDEVVLQVNKEIYNLHPLMTDMVRKYLPKHTLLEVSQSGKLPGSKIYPGYHQLSVVAIPDDPKFYSIAPGIDVIGYHAVNGQVHVFRSARNHLLTGPDLSRKRSKNYSNEQELEKIKAVLKKKKFVPGIHTRILFDTSRFLDTYVRAIPVPEAEYDFTHRLGHTMINLLQSGDN